MVFVHFLSVYRYCNQRTIRQVSCDKLMRTTRVLMRNHLQLQTGRIQHRSTLKKFNTLIFRRTLDARMLLKIVLESSSKYSFDARFSRPNCGCGGSWWCGRVEAHPEAAKLCKRRVELKVHPESYPDISVQEADCFLWIFGCRDTAHVSSVWNNARGFDVIKNIHIFLRMEFKKNLPGYLPGHLLGYKRASLT